MGRSLSSGEDPKICKRDSLDFRSSSFCFLFIFCTGSPYRFLFFVNFHFPGAFLSLLFLCFEISAAILLLLLLLFWGSRSLSVLAVFRFHIVVCVLFLFWRSCVELKVLH